MLKKFAIITLSVNALFMSCVPTKEQSDVTSDKFKLITLDPGHFHAALVQKSKYETVDSVVHIYSSEGSDLQLHLDKINNYNKRPENPTNWNSVVYSKPDFFEKMLAEKAGNVVVLAGNNRKKTSYILESVKNGFHVFADKPMAINAAGFAMLKNAFEIADKNNVQLYDIMTERFEISTMLQKELSQVPAIFGELEKGTPENPAVTKESVHHFFKFVSGAPLIRPTWFFDIEQEGEGIVDVTTHLVDLVQWECFPEKIIDTANVKINSAKRWATSLTLSDFQKVTGQKSFPAFLNKYMKNEQLEVFSNGEINYIINGVHAKVSVIWNFQAPEGTGDTHYSIMRGTKSNLIIRQGAEQGYKPTLYLEPLAGFDEKGLNLSFAGLVKKYPGVSIQKKGKEYEVIIPESYKEGHEAHFGRVMEKYLEYLQNDNMPAWEVPNMITKYYITTKAMEMAHK